MSSDSRHAIIREDTAQGRPLVMPVCPHSCVCADTGAPFGPMHTRKRPTRPSRVPLPHETTALDVSNVSHPLTVHEAAHRRRDRTCFHPTDNTEPQVSASGVLPRLPGPHPCPRHGRRQHVPRQTPGVLSICLCGRCRDAWLHCSSAHINQVGGATDPCHATHIKRATVHLCSHSPTCFGGRSRA